MLKVDASHLSAAKILNMLTHSTEKKSWTAPSGVCDYFHVPRACCKYKQFAVILKKKEKTKWL